MITETDCCGCCGACTDCPCRADKRGECETHVAPYRGLGRHLSPGMMSGGPVAVWLLCGWQDA